MPIHHPTTLVTPEPTQPVQFFEEVLLAALAARADAEGKSGRCAFVIAAEPELTWTVDLALRDVARGEHEGLGCRVRLSPVAFAKLVRGNLDVEAAVGHR